MVVRAWDFEDNSYDYRCSMLALTAGLSRLGCESVERYGYGYVTRDEESQPYSSTSDSGAPKGYMHTLPLEEFHEGLRSLSCLQ